MDIHIEAWMRAIAFRLMKTMAAMERRGATIRELTRGVHNAAIDEAPSSISLFSWF